MSGVEALKGDLNIIAQSHIRTEVNASVHDRIYTV